MPSSQSSASSCVTHAQIDRSSEQEQDIFEEDAHRITSEVAAKPIPHASPDCRFTPKAILPSFSQNCEWQPAGTYVNHTFVHEENDCAMPVGEAVVISSSSDISMVSLPPFTSTAQPQTPFSAMTLLPTIVLEPSPPTGRAQLGGCAASVALLYVVPAARVYTCLFHEPPLQEKRPIRIIPKENGNDKTEKQCDLCPLWVHPKSFANHRRHHYPPVWKCENCDFHILLDIQGIMEKAREAMVNHYKSCQEWPEGAEIANNIEPRKKDRLEAVKQLMETRKVQHAQSPPPASLQFPEFVQPSQSLDLHRIDIPSNSGALLSVAFSSSLNEIHSQAIATKGIVASGFGLTTTEMGHQAPLLECTGTIAHSPKIYSSLPSSLQHAQVHEHLMAPTFVLQVSPPPTPYLQSSPHTTLNVSQTPSQFSSETLEVEAQENTIEATMMIAPMTEDSPPTNNIEAESNALFAQFIFDDDDVYGSYNIGPDPTDGIQPYRSRFEHYHNLSGDIGETSTVQIGKRKCTGGEDEEEREREHGNYIYKGAKANKRQHVDSMPLSIAPRAVGNGVANYAAVGDDIWDKCDQGRALCGFARFTPEASSGELMENWSTKL